MVTLRFSPLIAWWWIDLLALAAMALLVLALLRRARGAWWRAAVLAVALLFLAGPMLDRETTRSLPDIGLMVLDQTPSMQVGDRMALEQQGRDALTAQAAKLPDLEWRSVAVPPADPHTGDSGTRLFAAIDRALTGIPADRLAGIVAITDGQVHDHPGRALAAPLNVLLPAAHEQTDRRIRVIEAPSFGLVGQTIGIKIVVDDLGVPPGTPPQPAMLTIHHDGAPVRQVPTVAGKVLQLDLPVSKVGSTIVDLAVSPLPGEVSDLNNHATLVVNGVRDRLRVLLLSGLPHPGEPVWRRMLKADPSVDLVHVTILRLPSINDHTPENELSLISFPSHELFVDKISDFDLIILDRFPHRGLLPDAYLQNIADYVRSGGALLVNVGPEFAGEYSLANSPLAGVLPAMPGDAGGVVEQEFRPLVSAIGQRHPVTENLPGANGSWGSWYRRIQPAGTRGQAVLDSPDGAPLLLLDRVGKGRVAMLLSDQIWLWARGHQGGGPAAELLRRVAHWLMKQPELEEENLIAGVANGHLRVSRRTLDGNPPPPVRITAPDGQVTTTQLTETGPGRAATQIDATLPGLWTVTDGVHTAYAAATAADPEEIADLRVTATVLDKIAAQSGGGIHWLQPGGAPRLRRVGTGAKASGDGWVGLRENHAQRSVGLSSVTLLPIGVAFLLHIGLLITAWWREGYREGSRRSAPPKPPSPPSSPPS